MGIEKMGKDRGVEVIWDEDKTICQNIVANLEQAKPGQLLKKELTQAAVLLSLINGSSILRYLTTKNEFGEFPRKELVQEKNDLGYIWTEFIEQFHHLPSHRWGTPSLLYAVMQRAIQESVNYDNVVRKQEMQLLETKLSEQKAMLNTSAPGVQEEIKLTKEAVKKMKQDSSALKEQLSQLKQEVASLERESRVLLAEATEDAKQLALIDKRKAALEERNKEYSQYLKADGKPELKEKLRILRDKTLKRLEATVRDRRVILESMKSTQEEINQKKLKEEKRSKEYEEAKVKMEGLSTSIRERKSTKIAHSKDDGKPKSVQERIINGYEVLLMPEPEQTLQSGMLYIEMQEGALNYAVINPKGKIERATISPDELPELQDLKDLPKNKSFMMKIMALLPNILKITLGRDHTTRTIFSWNDDKSLSGNIKTLLTNYLKDPNHSADRRKSAERILEIISKLDPKKPSLENDYELLKFIRQEKIASHGLNRKESRLHAYYREAELAFRRQLDNETIKKQAEIAEVTKEVEKLPKLLGREAKLFEKARKENETLQGAVSALTAERDGLVKANELARINLAEGKEKIQAGMQEWHDLQLANLELCKAPAMKGGEAENQFIKAAIVQLDAVEKLDGEIDAFQIELTNGRREIAYMESMNEGIAADIRDDYASLVVDAKRLPVRGLPEVDSSEPVERLVVRTEAFVRRLEELPRETEANKPAAVDSQIGSEMTQGADKHYEIEPESPKLSQ